MKLERIKAMDIKNEILDAPYKDAVLLNEHEYYLADDVDLLLKQFTNKRIRGK